MKFIRRRHVLVVIAIVLSACGSHNETASTPATPGVTSAIPAPTPTPAVNTAPTPSVVPSANLPSVAPTLDAAKGALAVAAYRARLARVCALAAPGEDATFVNIADGTDGMQISAEVCDQPHTEEPIASGSFFGPDEVVIRVSTGASEAEGAYALALMRMNAQGHYAFVDHLSHGNGFRVVKRIAIPSSDDLLVVCNERGSQGVYTSECGFLTLSGITEGFHESTSLECASSIQIKLADVRVDAAGEISLDAEVLHVHGTHAPDEDGEMCTGAAVTESRENFSVPLHRAGNHFEFRRDYPSALQAAYQATAARE